MQAKNLVVICITKRNDMEMIYANTLTSREKQIIEEVSKGLLDKEIASKICISTSTVKTHVKNIYRKLGVRNRVEASLKFFMYELQHSA